MISAQSIGAWVLATRPKTLPAAIVPVLVGSALAFAHGSFSLLVAAAALTGAVLIQVGTNLANDYFDFIKGADTPDRLGPTRAVAAGLLDKDAVRNAMAFVFVLACVVGVYLIDVGGWPILIIGILSVLSGIAYTGGPFPLAYHGLGDLFVFLFFGLAAVMGTYWVHTLEVSFVAFMLAVGTGALSVAILVVNNLRDIDTDARAGKRTLAVRMGRGPTRVQYALMLAVALLVPVVLVVSGSASVLVLISLLVFPFMVSVGKGVMTESGRDLNRRLEQTAKLLVIWGVLVSGALSAGRLFLP